MSDRHAASNIISIASLDGDRKEPCGRYIFSRPDQASRDAVPKLISSKRSAAPLKKGLVHHSSFDDSNHASPLVTYHKERPSNDSWYPIPFVTSPKEDNMIMSGVMEDFKRLMHGAFSEAKELPGRDSPSDIDVLCPKGGGNNVVAHPGNKYYSKLIEETVEHIYDKPDEDPDIVDAVTAARVIVKQIRSRNGKFLCKDHKDNSTWWDIGDAAAVRKTILRLKKAHKLPLENKAKAAVKKKAEVPPAEPQEASGTWYPKTVEDVMKVLVIPPRPRPTETPVRELNRKSRAVRSSSSARRGRKGSKSNATPNLGEPQSCLPPTVVSSHSLLHLLPRGQANAFPASGTDPSPPILSRGRSRSFENLFTAFLAVPSSSNLKPLVCDLSSRPKLKRKRSISLPNVRQRVALPPGRHSYHGTEEPVPTAVSSSSAFEHMSVSEMAGYVLSQDTPSNLYGSV